MKTIKNFMLPEHFNKLYSTEAASSIALTRDVAEKINELVDAYNKLSAEDLEWKHEQEGRIRKGVLYMKDNLANTIADLLDLVNIYNLLNEDTKAEIINRSNDLQKQINALASGAPIPVATITAMKDTSRIYVNTTDGKWYFYNGKEWKAVAVYQATKLGENEVTTEKRTVSGDYSYLYSEKGTITVDIDNLKININGTFIVVFRNRIVTIEPAEIAIPTNEPYMLYYDVIERKFTFHRPSSDIYRAGENCVYLGYISIVDGGYVHLNAARYNVIFGGKKIGYTNGTKQQPTRPADLLSGKVAIDTAAKTITFTNAVYSLGHRYVTVNSAVTYTEESAARIKYVNYDETTSTVKVYENRNTENADEKLLFAFYNKKLYHAYVNRHLYSINGVGESDVDNMFKGKTAAFIGDSITRGAGSSTPFTSYLAEQTGLSITNYGVDGSCVADKASETAESFIDRMEEWATADIIGVMGGINDYWNNVPIGDIDDTQTTTFYGALNNIATNLITKNPGKFIFLMTPINGYRSADRIAEGFAEFPYPTNGAGKTLDDYCDAVRAISLKYSIPLLDLKRDSGMCPLIKSEDLRLYHDGVHPNSEGYRQIAKSVNAFLSAKYR